MGALTGARVLSSSGPAIPVRLMPIGTVGIDLKQEFTAEGINQTRHRIWIHATARMRVILPVATREVEVSADLPLSETVIVGPVPSSFYGKTDGVTIPATH
jgi:sporulation protein YunB